MQVDAIVYILSLAAAVSGGIGIGYKFCPKTTHKPAITATKRECHVYTEHYPGRKGNRRFEVTLSDGKPTICNCPKLDGDLCLLNQGRCFLLK